MRLIVISTVVALCRGSAYLYDAVESSPSSAIFTPPRDYNINDRTSTFLTSDDLDHMYRVCKKRRNSAKDCLGALDDLEDRIRQAYIHQDSDLKTIYGRLFERLDGVDPLSIKIEKLTDIGNYLNSTIRGEGAHVPGLMRDIASMSDGIALLGSIA
jgi:hypothetical protein